MNWTFESTSVQTKQETSCEKFGADTKQCPAHRVFFYPPGGGDGVQKQSKTTPQQRPFCSCNYDREEWKQQVSKPLRADGPGREIPSQPAIKARPDLNEKNVGYPGKCRVMSQIRFDIGMPRIQNKCRKQ